VVQSPLGFPYLLCQEVVCHICLLALLLPVAPFAVRGEPAVFPDHPSIMLDRGRLCLVFQNPGLRPRQNSHKQ